jgi:hypothetical protein
MFRRALGRTPSSYFSDGVVAPGPGRR